MRIMTGYAGDTTILVEWQHYVQLGLHAFHLGQNFGRRLTKVPRVQRLFGGPLMASHAYVAEIAKEFCIFVTGLFFIG
jgi:hypothetical protein